ncbi:MAG: hypothetical protein EZS28_045265 [Streblomastix strix]|uniref:Uncharacterized protein n=1 Tax=Streblomastix strix TaxID=222440 RepID=A0A5J4TMK1_9EUKA|nr:MAG: hypothetical protein EZS28_045265 [Streblomastix strix]
MVRDYDGKESSGGQETSTAARRIELSEIADNGCVSSNGIDQQSKNRSVEKTTVEQQVEVGQKNDGELEMIGLDDQGGQPKDVRFVNFYIQCNDRCGNSRMGSGIGRNGEGGGDRW